MRRQRPRLLNIGTHTRYHATQPYAHTTTFPTRSKNSPPVYSKRRPRAPHVLLLGPRGDARALAQRALRYNEATKPHGSEHRRQALAVSQRQTSFGAPTARSCIPNTQEAS